MSLHSPVRASIDGGPFLSAQLTVDQEITLVRSSTAVKPDHAWSETDPAGHVHRFADGSDKVPSALKLSRPVPCDGSCGGACEGEGASVPVWTCFQCGANVTPRFVPDYNARTFGVPVRGPMQWTLTLEEFSTRPLVPATPGSYRLPVVIRLPNGDEHKGPFVVESESWTGELTADLGPKIGVTLVSAGEITPVPAPVWPKAPTLPEFIAQQLDADEDMHRRVLDVHDVAINVYGMQVYHPSDALTDIESRRRVLAAHPMGELGCTTCRDYPVRSGYPTPAPCPTLTALGSAFATRPGYDQRWRPL